MESPRPVRLWIDGDGCPVLTEARRIAARHGIPITLVAGPSQHRVSSSPDLEIVAVSGASEAADDYIASHAGPGEVVVTDDLPLADRCLKAGAAAVSSRGVIFSEENIGSLLAKRELGKFLRELGEMTGGPASFGPGFRSRFKESLHAVIEKLKREATRAAGDGIP
jgi:uncharacterized protein YaiI (UPF0178 family)